VVLSEAQEQFSHRVNYVFEETLNNLRIDNLRGGSANVGPAFSSAARSTAEF
jgi:hypothetical protein